MYYPLDFIYMENFVEIILKIYMEIYISKLFLEKMEIFKL